MIEVELPDGRVVEIETDDPQQAAKAAQRFMQQGQQAPNQPRADMAAARQQAMQETAQEVGPLEAFMIGTGKGFMDIGRGLGLADPATAGDEQAMEALRAERPYTTGAGEITGQAAPFVPAGVAAGAIRSLGGRVLAGTGIGAAEGGAIASGTGGDVLEGTGMGAAIGGGAEILFPVLGRLGRSLYRNVKGKAPKGAMLDDAGRPTPELQSALDEAGITMDDLTVDAQEVIRQAKPGSQPQQVARAARFAEEGVPMSRGPLTRKAVDEATEQQLLKSVADPLAEPFRQFKLKQSQVIDQKLRATIDVDQDMEETGQLIKDALQGRKSLLRTQKNDLYREALGAVDSAEALPIMANLDDAIPDARTLRGLDRASKGAASDVIDTLAEYGLTPPTERLLADPNFQPSVLTLQNFEEVNQILKGIARNDQSGAVGNLASRATSAIDEEVANLAENAKDMKLSDEVIGPLRKARETVRQLKTEFDPKALSGQLVNNLRNSSRPQVEASKAYSKLVSKAAPVEGIRSMVSSLRNAGPQGEQALAALQSTAMLDLLEAGFGTASRTIDGIRVFNPNAFRRRLKAIGEDKLGPMFSTSPSTLKRLKNIDKIAEDLIPSGDTVPKGSAPVLKDIASRLGLATISAKFPPAGMVADKLSDIASNYTTRREVRQAMQTDPDLAEVAYRLDREFPGIAAALGIAGISTMDEKTDDTNQNQ